MPLWSSLFYDFVSLLVIVNPVQGAAAFATLTYNADAARQRQIATRACLTALVILIVFAFVGELLLKALGISFAAFRVAGGLLILLVGISMVFAKETSQDPAAPAQDPSTFPLAIPIIAGPGALTTIVALVSKRKEAPLEMGLVVVLTLAVILLTFLAMRASQPLLRVLGSSGVNAVGRVMGILVASIAVQLMANGVRELFPS